MCEYCNWKSTGHGWQDHACWCPKTWAWVYREEEKPKDKAPLHPHQRR